MAANHEQTRVRSMLDTLMDPEIEEVIVHSKFVVHYLLHQDGPNPGWRKENLEGPVYVVRRKSGPKYQLLVKNQVGTNDLVENMHPNWELDCQNNYVFYKVEDPEQRIRGLWFHDDAERRKVEAALEKTLEELRSTPAEPQQISEPTAAPTPAQPKAGRGPPELAPPPPAATACMAESLLAKPPGPLADSNQLDPFCSMVESLQQQDPDIDQIVVYSKFVVHYLLQQDGPSPGWRKANVEGPVYVVRRRSAPKYQLLVKNQFNTINNLVDDLHPNWELDCQTNYVFYKVDDPAKRIRGLWFHDDSERKKVENILQQTLEELRAQPSEPQPPPMVTNPAQKASTSPGAVPPGMPPIDNNVTSESVTITKASLRASLHALADDDNFLRTVMQKIKHSAPQ